MSNPEPIAYTYEADTHCPPCTEAAFGRCYDGFIACSDPHYGERFRRVDSEGNPVGVIWSWDEWCNADETGTQYLMCGTCGGEIERHEHDRAPSEWGALIAEPTYPELDLADPRWNTRTHSDGSIFTAADSTHDDYENYILDPLED